MRKPHTPAPVTMKLGSASSPPPADGDFPPVTPPPPKRIYNVVDPSVLGRIWSQVYAAHYTADVAPAEAIDDATDAADAAVRHFIKLMREPTSAA